ncbi:hypothetical protein NIES22_38730 [Calothrix brevissima NIES-22]|nr:hypothetical protein NIES22_38730 [Calothrix brevissima NIES-22]
MPCPYCRILFSNWYKHKNDAYNPTIFKQKNTADCQLVRYRLSFIVGALALPCPEARTSFTGNMLYVETIELCLYII